MAVNGSTVYIGGGFGVVSGATRATDHRGGQPGPEQPRRPVPEQWGTRRHVEAAVTSNSLYAATGGQGGRGFRSNLAGAVVWEAVMDGDVQAVAILGDTIYWGGHFDRQCASTRTGAQQRRFARFAM